MPHSYIYSKAILPSSIRTINFPEFAEKLNKKMRIIFKLNKSLYFEYLSSCDDRRRLRTIIFE